MEPNLIRYQVHDFARACEALAGSAQVEAGLTDFERETICKSVQSLEEEVGPLAPQPSMDDPPLAATLSNLPPID